jgi:glycosyltransferase involved in cell wall biosynthesis
MRIAIVTDAWFPQTSGVVTTLSRMVEGLQGRGHEVEVVHPGMFKTIPCPTYPDIRLALWPGKALARRLEAFQPEAVHLPTEGPLGFWGSRWCKRKGYPYTTTYTTRFPEYIEMRIRIPAGVFYPPVRAFHNGAARTMVSTPSLKADLEARGFKNLVFWGRGVDTELFRPREKDALDAPRPIAVYLGRVAVEKNIEAFLELDLPGSKAVIGDGPALESLKRRFPDALFLGRRTGEDLARHLAACDVFVFPSKTDTFGIVLIEAMACGLPVAAYPVMGPKDVVRHGETGWLDDDLQTAVHNALELDPSCCREHACSYSWENSIAQFESNLAPFEP